MHRNKRVEKRLIATAMHPNSRKVKQAKDTMRHNMRVQLSRDTNKTNMKQRAGLFLWFKVQVSQFRQVDPRFYPSTTEQETLRKELSKPKKKRDVKYVERKGESDGEDSGLASELDDDEEEDNANFNNGNNNNNVEEDDLEAPNDNNDNSGAAVDFNELQFPDPLNQQEITTLAYHFIRRNDEELQELRSRRNPPHGAIKRLVGLKQKEEYELRNGFVVPDLTSGLGVSALLTWDGYDKTVATVPTVEISYDGGNPQQDLLPFNAVDILDVKQQRPGVVYQEEAAASVREAATRSAATAADGTRRNTKVSALGNEKSNIMGQAARTLGAKVGAKKQSTEEMVLSGRKRRARQVQTDQKKRFHQAIARSRAI